MRKIATLSLLLIISMAILAKQRTTEEALNEAQKFFNERTDFKSAAGDIKLAALSGDFIKNKQSLRSGTENNAFYVFNNGDSSFVIISGDDRMDTILAYSQRGSFITDNIPSNLQSILEAYIDYYASLDFQNGTSKQVKNLSDKKFASEIQPLLKDINWDQGEPYNNKCPIIGGKRSVTGCVATAMAMVMKYHDYPSQGKGSNSYTTESGTTYSYDFGKTKFDWNNMIPQYIQGKYTKTQADAVAELMYACGVAVNMEYSPVSSGAMSFLVAKALINYFGYNQNTGYVMRNYFSTDEWMNMLKKELNEKRPVLYNGASKEVGHEFVIDGYDKRDLVHVNWGWSGYNNGYFNISSLEPSSPGIGGGSGNSGGFTMWQGMIIGMQPTEKSTQYISYFFADKINANKQTVRKNETFDVNITNIFNMSSMFKEGSLSVIIEDKEGRQHAVSILDFKDCDTNLGFNDITLKKAFIPENFNNGIYRLYIGTKEKREKKYSKVRGTAGSQIEYMIKVEGNNCTLTPLSGNIDIEKELSAEMEIVHGLYSGMTGDFKVRFSNKNRSNEFYGYGGVVLLKQNGRAYEIVSEVAYDQILLPANTLEKEFSFSGKLVTYDKTGKETDIPAGKYLISPFIQWGEYYYFIGDIQEIHIDKSSICNSIKISNEGVRKSVISPEEELEVFADITFEGEGNIFNDIIIAAIFEEGENTTNNMHQQTVFVERTKLPYKLSMNFIPMVGTGKYFVGLFMIKNGEAVQISKTIPFEVSEKPTGTEIIPESNDGIKIYQTSGNTLKLLTPENAKDIFIISMSGNIIYRKSLVSGSKEHNLNVNNIPDGIYIATVKTSDGKVFRCKFFKH